MQKVVCMTSGLVKDVESGNNSEKNSMLSW